MTQESSNIGQVGVESIRIGGMRVQELPIAEAAIVKPQLPLARDTVRKNKINSVLKKYPDQRTAYLRSRIVECEGNVERVGTTRAQQNQMIAEYSGLLSMCRYRDEEIARAADEEQVKALKKRFPPYDVGAMSQQILQCTESIERADAVVAQEYKSIAEMRELIGLTTLRDNELKALGARIR